jgi:hypothetical protein
MAKTKISEFDSNPVNNTDIDGINLAEGMAPGLVNNAIRELMAQLKDFQAGTAGDNLRVTALGVGTAPSGTTGEIRATNNVTAFYSSDRKFKTNIAPISNALSIVQAIGTKTFDWTEDYLTSHGGEDGYFIQKQDFGVIAQDVQAVFPQAVRTRADGSLAVDYEKLGTLAFQAIIELTERVKALEVK